MIGFFTNYKLHSIVTFLLITSCIAHNKEPKIKENWCDYLIQQRISYLNHTNSLKVAEIEKKFCENYPRAGFSILFKIEKNIRRDWFEGINDDLNIDNLIENIKSKQPIYNSVFKDKLSLLKNEGLKFKLLLVEEMLMLQGAITEFQSCSFTNLENAISDIKLRYPDQYKSEKFTSRINKLKQEYVQIKNSLNELNQSFVNNLLAFNKNYKALQKDALLSNPLIKEASIIFITRKQYLLDHHNSATLFHTNETNTSKFTPGGSMKIIDLKKGGAIKTLIKTTDGIVRDPEISYDGKKIIFSMRKNIEEDYHIYEMNIDGTNIKQLTAAKGVSDIDPQYLPNGEIVFTSTREPKYCMCNIHIMGNIFKMQSDGANITQLGKSTLFEGHSTILPDGRILYDRWEYVDRNFGDAQGLWTMNPDGTNQAIYFGNNTHSPGGFIDARPIPGTDKVISVMGSCHDRPWGALGIINRNRGVDG